MSSRQQRLTDGRIKHYALFATYLLYIISPTVKLSSWRRRRHILSNLPNHNCVSMCLYNDTNINLAPFAD